MQPCQPNSTLLRIKNILTYHKDTYISRDYGVRGFCQEACRKSSLTLTFTAPNPDFFILPDQNTARRSNMAAAVIIPPSRIAAFEAWYGSFRP